MRSLVALALRSGIPVATWLEEDTATILTAFDLYQEEDGGRHRPGRVVMSSDD